MSDDSGVRPGEWYAPREMLEWRGLCQVMGKSNINISSMSDASTMLSDYCGKMVSRTERHYLLLSSSKINMSNMIMLCHVERIFTQNNIFA